ncbi:LysR family transcriptional regulator [Paraburkholderia lacunae]|uniref:HTH lysR-type domain-containing protein n=1 Tax=Paraburkholderia lacunae TaxID=2211104 RepID=A0A370N0B2_9BURK|nr:LysR family transcriptional regulator [Paraburkholderia lacunae]RDJ99051.1 hypothetical protein DLM46_30155 [Paraburkholderia lacunae]
MELRHLRYFVAVAEERNFTRAAERLHIAQPPLSRQIQQLEDSLGVQLFERTARPLKLTDTGRFFYSHAVQLLAQSADLESMTRRIYETRELQIALGLVAAGEGISIVPSSVYGLKRDDVSYIGLDDANLVSPIIMSIRMLDESEDISAMLKLIYALYVEEQMEYLPPHDR